MVYVKRGILLVVSAAALGAAPLVLAAPASACPYGTVERSAGVCTSGGQAGGPVIPPQAAPPGAVITGGGDEFQRVNGIPCTPENYGTCIALIQSQG